jgi:hypothetical protein
MFDWPYMCLRGGWLVYLDTGKRVPNAPRFATVAEAEAWLEANDIRGNVKESN